MSPKVFSKPEAILTIQLRYKERDSAGKMVFKKSKGITVFNITLEDAHALILKCLERSGSQ